MLYIQFYMIVFVNYHLKIKESVDKYDLVLARLRK